MALAPRWLDRNLTRLELVAVIAIMSILIGSFTTHALVVFARAEQRFLEASILNMNSVLAVHGFQMLMDGRGADLARLAGANPLDLVPFGRTRRDPALLVRYPELGQLASGMSGILNNYLGAFDAADPGQVDGGMWYFDPADRVLVYRIRNDEFFRSSLPGAARIRYALEIEFEDKDGNGEFTPGQDVYEKLVIVPRDTFTWVFFKE